MAASSPPSSDEQFAVGSVLDGRYRIEGVLGTGGMGRVYRAEHTKIGKSVAIKVLHADLGRNREASQRFQREAIASGRLDHPNIVGVSDFGVLDDGACFLVMEVLQGESLGDRLLRDKRIHWSQAIEILRGVLSGLRHAHERGVVHRDIKPDNVYLATKDGAPVVKILDFGIAKLFAGQADDPASTRAGLTVGTPAYLSPEQAVGGEITPASDLYSATVVLYEMLAGRAPFEDKDPLAMLGAHVGRRPPRIAAIAPDLEVPPALEAILERGLAKLAAERIATAADYLARLDALSPPVIMRSGSLPAVWPGAQGPQGSQGLGDAARYSPQLRLTPPPGLARTATYASDARGASSDPASPVVALSAGALAAAATPLPTTGGALAAAPVSLSLAAVSGARRAVSVADAGEAIPLTWIVRSGVLMGLVILVAIGMAIGARCVGGAPSVVPVASTARPIDREAPLAAVLRELESGKTCGERKAAIATLLDRRDLRDPRVVAALRRARDRVAPGEDSNACLKAEADRAVKQLAQAR